MNRPARPTLAALASLVLVALSLSACGGDDADDPSEAGQPSGAESSAPSSPTPEEPEASGSVWVTSADSGEIFQVDAATDEIVATVPATDLYPFDAQAGFDAVWVVTGYGGVKRIDPADGTSIDIDVPATPQGLVVGDDAVWVATGDGELVPIDPASNAVGAPVALGEDVLLDSMVWLDGAIVADNSYDASVVVVDPTSGVTSTVEREDVVFRAVGDGGTAWFAGFAGVEGYDTAGSEVESFPSQAQVSAIAADPDSEAMWVGYADGTVATLDTATGEYGTPATVGDTYVGDLEYADGALWAAIEGGSLYRLDPETLAVESEIALPTAEGSAAIAVS